MKKFDTFQAFARGAKSLVAILLVMLMAVGSLFAQTTYTFSNYTAGAQYAIEEQHVLDDVLTIYTTECHFRTDQLRIYSSSSHNGFFYSNALPNNIDSISFNIGYKVDNLLVYGSSDGLTWTLVGSIATTETYTDRGIGFGNNEFNYFKCDVEGDQQLRITSFTMFYKTTPEPPTPIVVSVPTFAPEAGTYTAAQNVTIACATEGAAIYYTLDGTTPTANSTLYENAIEITETTTINAIAFVGETASDMATATYTINVTPIEPDEPTVLDLDSIATLPYAYNFDEGTDPYFMINNGEATNAWYVGQAQGFNNNKLYISSNGGTTNKYDITKASTVTAYRDVMIPETGAILTFDYRVNGQTNTTDYLKVDLNGTEIATLSGVNEWSTFSYDISGEMAGEVRVQFTWVNNATNGNQFPAAIDNISIIETPCSQPTALTATVDSTTAVITWQAVEGQTAWNLQYKLADHSEWYTVPATATTVTLTDLQGNSNYEMRVQAVCGENVSAWTNGTFAVACQTEEVTVTPTDVVIGTGTSTTSYIFPGFYGWQYSASLYDMENAGPINSIAFYLNAASTTSGSSMTVWVKAVPSDYALASSNTFGTMVDGAQQIYDGAPDFSTAGWITFPVNNFTLAEGQDLLVLVRGVGCSTSGGCSKQARYTSTSNKLWYKLQDSSDPGQSVTGTMSSYRPNITINMDVTVVTCDDQIACVAPTGLQVSDVTANSAVLTWTPGDENQTSFIVEYLPAGATEWTSVDVNDNTYTLTELAQMTYYSVKVKANCGENNWSDVITAIFRTEGICPPVTNLETSNVSNTTTLTWEPGGEESAWLVQFKPASEGDDAWTSINVNMLPMTTFGGLVGNTDYDVRVKALCDPENTENQSEWTSITFHSGCAAFDLPFAEEFPTNTMPICWENEDFHFASSGYAYSYTNEAALITPAINIPAENPTYLSFEVRGAGEYTVLASYRGTRADRFEEIYTGIAPNQNTIVTIAIADLYKGRAVNFKIVNNSTSYQYFYYVKVNQCPFVATALTASNVTGTTLDLAWESEAANFQVQYGEQGFNVGEGTSIDVNGATTVAISELNYETPYDFYVRVVCEGDNGAWAGPVTVTTAPSCSEPTGLSFEIATNMLFWQAGEWGTPVQYNVRYKAEDEEEYTTMTVDPVVGVDPFTVISGLNSNTTYEIGVQSVCGENQESGWTSIEITTPCMAMSLPYIQDFDSYTGTTSQSTTVIPDCWERKFTGTSTSYGAGIWNSSAYAVSGTNSLRMYNYCTTNTTSATYGDLYVVLPRFEANINTIMVSFDAKKYNSTSAYYISNFEIGVVTDKTQPEATFTSYRTLSATSATTADKIDVPFDAYNGVDGYIAFRMLKERPSGYTNNYAYNYVYIDNLNVGPIPTCFVPSIAVSGTEATITPNANGNPAQSYNLKIGEVVANTTATTVDLTTLFTLEANTDYTISVQAVCGANDESEWSDGVVFTTPCMAISVPYTQDFEDYTGTTYSAAGVIPDCWNRYATGSVTPHVIGSGSYYWVNSGTKALTFYGSGDCYAVLPEFSTPISQLQIDFWMRTESASYGTLTLGYITAADNNMSSYTVVETFSNVQGSGAERSVLLNNVPATAKHLVFKWSYTSQWSCCIDDISVTMIPTCGVPSISVDGTTATIVPSSIGTAESYDLQIGNAIQNVTSTTVDLMDLFTLESATSYEVSVRANCGGGDHSEWSNPVSFVTPCETTCTYTLTLSDSYGDGWNGNAINVLMNGTTIATLTIQDGSQYTGTVSACGEISFAWVTGSYANETSFTIEDESGNTLYTCTSGSSLTNGQVFYSTTCGGAVVTCHAPEQLTVSEISETSATITWVDEHEQSAYTLQYMAENDADWTTVENIDTNYYILTNLTASTEYTVRVKAVCGTDDESDYTLATAFRTNCIGGGEVEIAGTGGTTYYLPVDNYYHYSYTQQIIDAAEMGGAGTINSISFEYNYATPMSVKNNVKIYLGTTDKTEFSSTTDWVTSGLQEVYSGALNCSQGWNDFAFATPFTYNGGNIVVVIEDMSDAYDGSAYTFKQTSTSGYKGMYYHSDSNPFTGSNTASGRTTYRSNMKMSVCPEAIDLAITDINSIADACDVEGAVTINVKNQGYEGTVSTFEAYYQVNDGTPVHETVTLATPIAFNEAATYTFNQLPTFAAGANFIVAWVELEGDLVDANNTVASAPITVLEPATVPYVETFAGLTINHGWNPIDANNDGVTMNLDNEIYYTFNDLAAADDWMMSPCIEMAAGTYTIIYDYKANSSLTEAFEVFYGNGAHVADMTNAVATHSFNNTDYETATTTITIAADGIYNFGFHATSLAGNLGFSIDNFKVYPVNDVVVTYAENGTVTPNGTIAVNYGEDLTLNLVPDPMYHVAGVWVDNVQVVPEDGTGANFMLYTLENVTEPHTVFVDFKLEFHIFKSVENYRSDLYSDLGGAFVPAATDTTINPDPFTVTMVADPHYHLNDLTLSPMDPTMQMDVFADVIDNGDGTYNYTIDTLVVANYYLNATFRRDTVAINYNVLTGKGFANDSELMNAGDTYTTWVDYPVNNDVDTTVTFYADENDGYHIVDVIVNGTSMGRIDSYTFTNVTETQNVDLKFGYKIDAFVSNYNTYDSITDVMGTIAPSTQYVAEYDPMMVVGSVEEHFHLYQLLVNGVNRIDEVVFSSDPHYYYFSMDSVAENYTIEAVVKVDTFAIVYHVLAGQGTADASGLLVEGDSYSTILNYADNWYSNITPATGYSIGNVTLDGQNLYTANNYQFNYIEESHEFYITFEPNIYTVTVNAYGEGTVSDGMTFTYDPDNAVNYNLNAFAAEGYHIASVVINNEEMEITDPQSYAQTIENVADNYVINVHFAINTYTMTAEASNGGTITPNGTQVVNYGSNVNYEIVANQGWYIAQTVIDGVTTDYTQADDVVSLTVPFTAIDANHSVSVLFDQFMYNITGTVGANGTVNGETTINASMPYGSNYSLTIVPADNYQVADVVVDGVSVGAVNFYEFINITDNHTVDVTFEATMFTLTATSNVAACTITPATTTVQAGSDVNYTLTVANGYHLQNVIANGQEVVVTNNAFTISDVQSDYIIYANFASDFVTVTVNQPAHATITPGTQTYAYGATPSYMIVPEVGYDVVSVTAGNAVVPVTYNNGIGTFTLDPVQADITLTATTSIKKFQITVTQGANGTIAPGTQSNVEYGSNKTFTITPADYYVIADVIVDGTSRGALSSYTFYNVTGNHTITAVFEANCQTPTNLTAMNIDTTSALLTWMGTATSYEVRYKAFESGVYMNQTVTTTSLQLTDLLPGTMYEYGVRAICGANLTSDWATNAFTTRALPVGPVDGIANADMSSIKVYSFQNNVYIVNEDGIAISNVDIYDIYGKQVYTGKVLSSPEVISLNVANGNYVVRLATENGVGVYKVAIVR